jgi:hypothetical protein
MWGKDKCGVTRVDTGILDVFGYSVDEKFTLVCDGVDVDLLSVVDELGDDDGVIGRDIGSSSEVVFESGLGMYNIHCGSGQYIGGSD